MEEIALTPAEQAYVNSGGNTDLAANNEPAQQEDVPVSEVVREEAEDTPVEQPVVAEEKPRERLVPYDALHNEREQRKAVQKQWQEEREARLRLEERWKMIEAANQPAQPKLDEDPVAYFQAQQERQARELEEMRGAITQRQQQEQVAQYQSQVVNSYRAAAQEVVKELPDFKESYEFLMNSRVSELKAAGYSHEQAWAATQQDEFNIVANALQNGQNPAKVAYEVAKARGYAPKPKASAADKLETIEAGQRESKSLTGAGGGGLPDSSIDSLLNMSDAEFMKAINNGNFKKAAGG